MRGDRSIFGEHIGNDDRAVLKFGSSGMMDYNSGYGYNICSLQAMLDLFVLIFHMHVASSSGQLCMIAVLRVEIVILDRILLSFVAITLVNLMR
jgi:hypothetical protein